MSEGCAGSLLIDDQRRPVPDQQFCLQVMATAGGVVLPALSIKAIANWWDRNDLAALPISRLFDN
jgi:hypothetical protein